MNRGEQLFLPYIRAFVFRGFELQVECIGEKQLAQINTH